MGMNPTLKLHLISAAKTFVAGFIIGALPYLHNLDWATFGKATFFGIFLTGVRAGVKVVAESDIIPWARSILSTKQIPDGDLSV